MSTTAIIVLLFFVVSIPLSLWRPFYGILAWTFVAFVNPQWLAWGVNHDIARAEVIAIPTLIGLVISTRNWRSVVTRECGLLLLLWIWFTLTSLISSDTPLFASHSAETWARWKFVSIILVMTYATVLVVNTRERLRMVLIVIAASFGLFIFKAIPFMITTGGNFKLYGPDYSMLSDNNDFGLALNMTLPIFFFLAQTEERPWARRICWLLCLGTIPAIFFTYSRGALVGLMAVMLALFLQLKQRRFVILIVVGMSLAIGILFAPQKWRDRMGTLDDSAQGTLDASAQSRINAWTYSWRLATDYPITGGGFDTYTPELFDRYAPNRQDVHGPHSVYFGVLAEHGFVGLALYLALLASSFLTTGWAIKYGNAQDDAVAVGYGRMLRVSMVGFMVSGAFLGRAYFDYLFTIIALTTVLKYSLRTEWRLAEAEYVPDEEQQDLEYSDMKRHLDIWR